MDYIKKEDKGMLSTEGIKNKEVINVSYELPKSFTLCVDKFKKQTVYISQISSSTLNKRSEYKAYTNK